MASVCEVEVVAEDDELKDEEPWQQEGLHQHSWFCLLADRWRCMYICMYVACYVQEFWL